MHEEVRPAGCPCARRHDALRAVAHQRPVSRANVVLADQRDGHKALSSGGDDPRYQHERRVGEAVDARPVLLEGVAAAGAAAPPPGPEGGQLTVVRRREHVHVVAPAAAEAGIAVDLAEDVRVQLPPLVVVPLAREVAHHDRGAIATGPPGREPDAVLKAEGNDLENDVVEELVLGAELQGQTTHLSKAVSKS